MLYLDGKCGLYHQHTEIEEMIIIELPLETKSHLVSMKVMKSHDSNPWTERALIENRLNKIITSTILVLDGSNERCVSIHMKSTRQKVHLYVLHQYLSPSNLTVDYAVCFPIGSMLFQTP